MDTVLFRPPTRWLLVAFVATVLSFVAATIYTQRVASNVDAAAISIIEDASPSIEHLALLRGETRQIEHLLNNLLDASRAHSAADLAKLAASREALDVELRAYAALPRYSGELADYEKLREDWAIFDHCVAKTIQQATRGDLAPARETEGDELRPAADKLVGTAMRLIEIDADQGHRLAEQALTWRRHAAFLARALDAGCVFFATVCVFVVVGAFRRHTAVIVAHAELLQLRGNELESFSARVAHDVMSPLGGVKLAIDAASRKTQSQPEIQKLLARADRSLTRATQVVNALYAFARAGAKAEASARVAAEPPILGVLEEVRREADAAGIELYLEPCLPVEVACEEGVLVCLVSNLVRNAIKYMGDAQERRVVIRLEERGNRIRVEVTDTGPGLPSQIERGVFEPYVRAPGAKQAGIGLGLATVKRLADGHGGSVGFRTSSRGSTFWFELPKSAQNDRASRAMPRASDC